MTYKHFTQIYKWLCGYKVSTRTGDDDVDDVWLQNKNRQRELEPLKKVMFKPSIEIFNKKSGQLVLDDELIGSCAGDMESKHQSNRKASQNRPVATSIADSHLDINFGFQSHLSGESTIENIQHLPDGFPTLTSTLHHVEIKFNKGYALLTFYS